MKLTTSLTLFNEKNWSDSKPFLESSHKYQLCYEYLFRLAEAHGVKMYRASYEWFNKERNSFDHAWTYENGIWVRANDIQPDVIWDKLSPGKKYHAFKEYLSSVFPILNDPQFTKVANDKYEVARMFPDFMKQSTRVKTGAELKKTIEQMPGNMIVLKPIVGSGGKGVQIISREEAETYFVEEPMIVQEFIDSSKGIPGIVKGTHDLRLIFVNDELIYSYIRQPAEGSYLANLAQGGSMFIVEPDNLPETLQPAIHAVQEQFREYPGKIYTIDFMFDESRKPWIIELNTMPGMYFSEGQEDEQARFYHSLIDTIIETAQL